jgi:hypothetical protein
MSRVHDTHHSSGIDPATHVAQTMSRAQANAKAQPAMSTMRNALWRMRMDDHARKGHSRLTVIDLASGNCSRANRFDTTRPALPRNVWRTCSDCRTMKVDQVDESPARMEARFAYYDKRRTKSLANALSASSDGFRIANANNEPHTFRTSEFL